MQIIIAHPLDPMNLKEGGSIRYAWELIKMLLNHGIETTLLGVQFGEEFYRHPKFKFIPIVKGSDSWFFYHLGLATKLPFLKIPKDAVIHVMRPDFMFYFVLFKPKNPKVLTSDKPDEWMRREHPIIYKLGGKIIREIIERFTIKNIDQLITDKRTVLYYLKKYPHLDGKISFYKPFIDTEKFIPMDKDICREKYGFKNSQPIVLFIGRIAPIKNIELLIHSFAIVEKLVPQSFLVIVGRGNPDYEKSLIKLAENLEIKNILFTGEIHPDKIPEVINCADVLILTSHIEGSPTVVREALACGVPVVSTDAGDVKDVIVKEKLGKIVGYSTKEIAEALKFYLNKKVSLSEKEIIRKEFLSIFPSKNNFIQGLMNIYKKSLLNKKCSS